MVSEDIPDIEVKRAAVVHRDGAGTIVGQSRGGACSSRIKQKGATIDDRAAGVGVRGVEGRGAGSTLGEGTGSRNNTAQGLVRRVAEDE